MITSQELIDKYLKFFQEHGHALLPPAPLVPENDPTVLFTTAGMHPLVPYLLGQPHPQGKRLVNVQPCVRTVDINEVGDDTHLTFFEMLGNWSLGDYFKKESIAWSLEFLTEKKWLHLPPKKLAVSVFGGDENAPHDDESEKIWQKLGVPAERIRALGRDDNWWGPAGITGPCGPDTEIFYWTGATSAPQSFDPQDKRWVEIWNNVFMEYRKNDDGTFESLKQKNVDTGMGVARTLTALNGASSVYEMDVFTAAMGHIKKIAKDVTAERPMRIIADHILASVMIAGGANPVTPSNIEQGYILRRLIRRAIRYGRQIGTPTPFTAKIADDFIPAYGERYPELAKHRALICNQLTLEEEKFAQALDRGERELQRHMRQSPPGAALPGQEAFNLFQSYGFPVELTEEIAREAGHPVDTAGFAEAMREHQELSRTAAAGRFRSGLADTTQATTQLHTATHLLHAALRQVLGTHVQQKGSNITPERLRFDFSHPHKMTAEQIHRVEDLVNQLIRRGMNVTVEEMGLREAMQRGALGFFGHKYAGKVTVYTIGDFSQEICTGPHVQNTAEIGSFHIAKEEASSAGVRRIKAVVQASP